MELFDSVFTSVLAVLGLSLLIILHELGHYLVAKWSGMGVSRFSVGFGPVIFSKEYKGTLWQLAALPLGGYVLIDGMMPDDEEEGSEEIKEKGQTLEESQEITAEEEIIKKYSGNESGPNYLAAGELSGHGFNDKPLWQRMAVVLAGPVANFILGIFLFVLAFTQYNRPAHIVKEVYLGGPAIAAGVVPGDKLVKIGSLSSEGLTIEELELAMRQRPFQLSFQNSEGQLKSYTLKENYYPEKESKAAEQLKEQDLKGQFIQFGVSFESGQVTPKGLGAALNFGWSNALAKTFFQFEAIPQVISGKGGENGPRLQGPLGIFKQFISHAEESFWRFVGFLAVISCALAAFNLFPIPALDGGRMVFLIIEGLRGKPLNKEWEGYAHFIGFICLMSLIVWVTIKNNVLS